MPSKLALAKRLKQNLNDLRGRQYKGSQSDKALIDKLSGSLERYLDEVAIAKIYRAVEYGANAHRGQKRKSGEDYIHHPVAVARILSSMNMDCDTIIAAILHDVIEDTSITLSQLATEFGGDVADLVDGVSKVSQIELEPKIHSEAASFRKMFMAMAKDSRVIIIKLTDRLHNMHTLEALDQNRKIRIAKQTLEIYAPIANLVGMRELAEELEVLSLKNLYPSRYRVIKKTIASAKRDRKGVIKKACKNITYFLKQNNIPAKVESREKTIYSIYKEMQQKKQSVRDFKDINSIRIITEKRPHCYEVLGVVHEHYIPVPGGFQDYIATPKGNGYQSLHTIIVGPSGNHLKVQIRSQKMHIAAEKGLVSHWMYKTEITGKHAPQQIVQQWVDDFAPTQNLPRDSEEYLEHLKTALSPDEVNVFTPKGEMKKLPRFATALDFAYAVHSDVGNRCVGAKVDNMDVPLHERLSNGDKVEVITSRKGRPSPSWLDYAVSSKARVNIRHYLNKQKSKESRILGKKLLRTALNKQGYRWKRIRTKQKTELLDALKLNNWNQLLTEIGFGERHSFLVAKQMIGLVGEYSDNKEFELNSSTLTIEGTEGFVITYANCCHPIPGDKISGNMERGHGIVIHRSDCKYHRTLVGTPESYFHLNWGSKPEGKFIASLAVLGYNIPGALASISNIFGAHDSNIKFVSIDTSENPVTMSFQIEVMNKDHLDHILRLLLDEECVMKVSRV